MLNGFACLLPALCFRYEGCLLRATIQVQALRRGSVLRRKFLQQRQAAIAIQAAMRGWQQRQRFLEQRAAAVAIQAGWRRHVVEQQLAQAEVKKAWTSMFVLLLCRIRCVAYRCVAVGR